MQSIEKAQQDYTNSQHRYEAVEEDLQDQVRRYRHQLSRLHLFQSEFPNCPFCRSTFVGMREALRRLVCTSRCGVFLLGNHVPVRCPLVHFISHVCLQQACLSRRKCMTPPFKSTSTSLTRQCEQWRHVAHWTQPSKEIYYLLFIIGFDKARWCVPWVHHSVSERKSATRDNGQVKRVTAAECVHANAKYHACTTQQSCPLRRSAPLPSCPEIGLPRPGAWLVSPASDRPSSPA